MERRKKNIFIGILGVTTVVAAGVAVYFGNVGQGSFKYELVLCVLEDGSVYCMRLYNAISNNDYDDYTKLDEISDIIDLKTIAISTQGPGWYSIAAIRRDGKFYDLEEILRNRGLVE